VWLATNDDGIHKNIIEITEIVYLVENLSCSLDAEELAHIQSSIRSFRYTTPKLGVLFLQHVLIDVRTSYATLTQAAGILLTAAKRL